MQMDNFNRNRTTIVGIGGFGLHVLAHVMPRLTFMDYQRRLRWPHAPAISDVLSYVLILPTHPDEESGGTTFNGMQIYQPRDPERTTLIYSHSVRDMWRDWKRQTGDFRPADAATREELQAWETVPWAEAFNQRLIRRFVGHGPEVAFEPFGEAIAFQGLGRRAAVEGLAAEAPRVGQYLEKLVEHMHVDARQPMEDVSRSTVYLVASLADPFSSALVWPVGRLLKGRFRERMSELVGLFSVGAYGSHLDQEAVSWMRREACAYMALVELETYQRDRQAAGLFDDPWWQANVGQRGFDTCYLVDQIKSSGASVEDEHEAAVCLGNAIEAFVASAAGPQIQTEAQNAPHNRSGEIYSALGSATRFLPVREILDWIQERLMARLLDDFVLREPDPDRPLVEATEFCREFLSPREILDYVCRGLPVSLTRAGSATGDDPLPRYGVHDRRAFQLRPGIWWTWPAMPVGLWRRGYWEIFRRFRGRWLDDLVLQANLRAGTATLVTMAAQDNGTFHRLSVSGADPVTATVDVSFDSPPVTEVNRPFPVWAVGRNQDFHGRQAEDSLEARTLTLQRSIVGQIGQALTDLVARTVTATNNGLCRVGPVITAIEHHLFDQTAHCAARRRSAAQDEERARLERDTLDRQLVAHAQQRPLLAAVLGRSALLAIVVAYLSTVWLMYRMPSAGTLTELLYFYGLVLASALWCGLWILFVYSVRDYLLRRRYAAVTRALVEAVLNRELAQITESVLDETARLVSDVKAQLQVDREEAETFRSTHLNQPDPTNESLSDTHLRAAVASDQLFRVLHRESYGPMETLVRKGAADDLAPALRRGRPIRPIWELGMPASAEAREHRSAGRLEAQIQRILLAHSLDLLTESAQMPGALSLPVQNSNPTGPQPQIWPLLSHRLEQFVTQHTEQDPQVFLIRGDYDVQRSIQQEWEAAGESAFDPHACLSELGYVAKPLLHPADEAQDDDWIRADVLVARTGEPERSDLFVQATAPLLRSDARWATGHPSLVHLSDPYTLTYLRTLHGFGFTQVPSLERYAGSLRWLANNDDTRPLLRDQMSVLDPDNGYPLSDGGPDPA